MCFIKRNRTWLGRILLLILIGFILGCAPGGAKPKGWSGGILADGTLVFGSMEGKLVGVDISSGARLWTMPLASPKPTGGVGCAGPATSVAVYGTPAVSGNLVYIGGYVQEGTTSRGKIYAFNLGRDEPRWVYPREGYLDGPVVGALVVSQDRVYFGASDGKVYALDAADGHKLAEFQTGDKIWSTPVVDGDTVYIGSFDKKLYALDAASLKPVRWKTFETGGAIAAMPLVYKGTIYVGSFDRYLYAVDARDGGLRWKFLAENWFWARPVAYNNVIYAPSLDHKVYVLNAETGSEEAPAIDLGSPISSSPLVVDGKIIIASEEGKVFSLEPQSKQLSEVKNFREKIYAALAASGSTIYIHTSKDALYALELKTGAIREFQFK